MLGVSDKLDSILDYWFGKTEDGTNVDEKWRGSLWWKGIDPGVASRKNDEPKPTGAQLQSQTDQFIRKHFADPLLDVIKVENLTTDQQKVAALILWDQFPRNAFRGTSRAFAYDTYAQELALHLLPDVPNLPWNHALFVCVALLHAEDADAVEQGMHALEQIMAQSNNKLTKRLQGIEKSFVQHLQVLQQFGRYPSRNEALERVSTVEEIKYLANKDGLPRWAKSQSTNIGIVSGASTTGHPLKKIKTKKSLRILVLHGNRANLTSFRKRVREKLNTITSDDVPIVFDFLKAPHVYRTQQTQEKKYLASLGVTPASNASDSDNRCWWTATENVETMHYDGLEQSIDAVETWFQQNGPYDGLLGFAQGATMAGILAALMDAGKLQYVRFQFLISISGFYCRDTRPPFATLHLPEACVGHEEPSPESIEARQNKIRVKSFHTWGKQDELISGWRSQVLADAFADAVVMPHDGAHLTRAVQFWPTVAINEWIHTLNVVKEQDTNHDDCDAQFGTFFEKFQAIKSQHSASTSRTKNAVLRPVGLHHQEEILGDIFWDEVLSLTVEQVSFKAVDALLFRLLKIVPKDGKNDHLVDDLMAVAWCLYPFGLRHKKLFQRLHEGQAFFWIFRLLVDRVSDAKSRERLVGYHLDFISEHANSWDALERIDLLFITGSSLRNMESAWILDPSPFAELVHDKIAELFAEQLTADLKKMLSLKEKIKEKESSITRTQEMGLKLPSNCAQHTPRGERAIHKKTKLAEAIAEKLTQNSKIAMEAYPRMSPKNRYKQLIRDIRNFLSEFRNNVDEVQRIDKDLNEFLHLTEDQWRDLHQKPISEAILQPTPELVEVARPEQMAPLQTFLNQSPVGLPLPQVHFDRGTLLNDGRLDLCKQVIGPLGINPLFQSLQKDKHGLVKHLLLGNNVAGNDLGRAVGDFIRSGQSQLTTWYVAGNRMNVDGIRPIAEALELEDKQVQQLWLKRNPLLPAGAAPIASMLRVNSHLRVLDLTNTGILDEGAEKVMQAVASNPNSALEHLYLDTNGITVKGAADIARCLGQLPCKSLCGLGLGCNRLGDEGVAELLQGIRIYGGLKRLTLSSCAISAVGAATLADFLAEPECDLRFLDIGCMKSTRAVGEIPNRISSHGAIALARVLEKNPSLEGLSLGHNVIHQNGFAALEQALRHNTTLRHIAMPQPGIPLNEITQEKIRLYVRKNAMAWKSSQNDKHTVNDYVEPKYLDEIQSVYRVGNSYQTRNE